MILTSDILNQIEKLRQEMIRAAEDYGFQHEKTLEISKKLDKYLNEYEKQKENKN